MCEQTSFLDMLNVTSLPVLEDGLTPSSCLGGKGGCGPGAARASRSVVQGKVGGRKTRGTCGRSSTGSSASVVLQQCLESRLRAGLEGYGSAEYALTWKHWDMESGPRICALRASGRRTSGKGCGGWATPAARDFRSESATDEFNRKRWAHPRGKPLSAQAAGWPSPDAAAMNVGADLQKHLARVAKLKAKGINGNGAGLPLGIVSQMAGWPTPTHKEKAGGEYKDPQKALARFLGPHSNDLRDVAQCVTEHGETASTSPAPTEKRGQLNPELPRWLMGYPVEWGSCGATAMQSYRRSPRNSSKPT